MLKVWKHCSTFLHNTDDVKLLKLFVEPKLVWYNTPRNMSMPTLTNIASCFTQQLVDYTSKQVHFAYYVKMASIAYEQHTQRP